MADIEVHRTHELGLAAARRAAEQMAADLARKFDLHANWEGDVMRFRRSGVGGSLALTERELRLSISLGFLLKAMQSSIEKAVLHELDTLFARPAKARAATAAGRPTPRRDRKRPKKDG